MPQDTTLATPSTPMDTSSLKKADKNTIEYLEKKKKAMKKSKISCT